MSDISHVIKLAFAPVFLLAGIGAFINAFAVRPGRILSAATDWKQNFLKVNQTDRLPSFSSRPLSLIGGLLAFLREIFLAVRGLTATSHYLEIRTNQAVSTQKLTHRYHSISSQYCSSFKLNSILYTTYVAYINSQK